MASGDSKLHDFPVKENKKQIFLTKCKKNIDTRKQTR
jgi:hypothetical protein